MPEPPNVPSLAEVGATPFDGGTTLGLYVRAGTPRPIVEVLNAATVAVLNEAAVRQKFNKLGATVRPSTSEEFAAFQKTDEAALGDLAAKGLPKPQ